MDLVAAYYTGVMLLNTPRGDEAEAHVSDYGKCLYDVWARRNRQPRVQRSALTAARLQKGLHDETFIVERVMLGIDQLGEGWTLDRTHVVHTDVVGHLDMLIQRSTPAGIERRYIEIKTTEWVETWEDKPGVLTATGRQARRKVFVPREDGPSETHILQSGGYCLECEPNPDGKHMPFAIVQFDRRSNQVTQFPGDGDWYHPNEPWLYSQLVSAKAEILETTAPGSDPVETGAALVNNDGELVGIPKAKWMCGYCDNALCPSLTNPDALRIPT